MIKIYTTPACPVCYVLKTFLKEKGIEFEEIDVANNEKAREEMIQKSGALEAPVIEINGQFIVGFDKNEVVKLLNIKE